MDIYFEIADITASAPLLLFWGLITGLVYSTVGAAGGILASVGLITVFGLQDANMIKPMAQSLTLITPLIAVPLYMKQCRVVYTLSILLGLGGIIGALIGSTLSSIWLSDMSVFKPVFALLVFFIAVQMLWQLLRKNSRGEELSHTMRAAECFERHIKKGGKECEVGVKRLHVSISRIVIEFGNQEFSFSPFLPFIAGLVVAVLSSALGVGGGFLLVPFMTLIMKLPMHIIAGTSALAISIHSLTSIANYVRIGVELDYGLIGIIGLGIIVGSVSGPFLSRHISEKWLRTFLAVVLLVIGFRYVGLY